MIALVLFLILFFKSLINIVGFLSWISASIGFKPALITEKTVEQYV